MNNAVLIQTCSENWEGINLLKVTASRHLEYCMMHKIDFRLVVGGDAPRYGDWRKVQLIRETMNEPYQYIIHLDVDTLIVNMGADLRDGCPADGIGCARHILTSPPYSINLDHLNVGALYLQNTEANRERMDKWIAGAPGSPLPAWWEQGVLNNLGIGTEIDAKWNATGKVNPSPSPVVLGFHGQGNVKERFNLMNEALERSR